MRSQRDVPELDWIFALAQEGSLVVNGHRLTTTELGDEMGLRSMEAWRRILEGLLDVGVTVWIRGQNGWQPLWAARLMRTWPTS